MDAHLDAFNAKLLTMIENMPTDLESEETARAVKNLADFSKCRPPAPQPAPSTDVVVPETPEPTRRQKVMAGMGRVLDNETMRTFIKAGGTFAGVALVAYSTIHKDHVLERQALAQANTTSNK